MKKSEQDQFSELSVAKSSSHFPLTATKKIEQLNDPANPILLEDAKQYKACKYPLSRDRIDRSYEYKNCLLR